MTVIEVTYALAVPRVAVEVELHSRHGQRARAVAPEFTRERKCFLRSIDRAAARGGAARAPSAT